MIIPYLPLDYRFFALDPSIQKVPEYKKELAKPRFSKKRQSGINKWGEQTAKNIEEARKTTPDVLAVGAASRGAMHHGVPIHAIRLPGVLAVQTVMFGGLGETFSMTHNTLDRQCFVPGMVFACEQVMRLDRLVYGLEALIF